MNKNFDELAKGLKQSGIWRALRKFGIGLAGVALVCGGGSIAWADWSPPESSVTPPAVVTLDTFAALDANGAIPLAALVVGPDGALYGSTRQGGGSGYGTLFRVELNGTFRKLHDFNGTDGDEPLTALVVGPDGALYGSTSSGGAGSYLGDGTLFRVETNGSFIKLHDFNSTNDGAYPSAPLVVGPDGALYGSAPYGGTNGNGTLFRVETNGAFTKLHDFNRTNEGYNPSALVVGSDGALYGSTSGGGSNGDGTLFRLETDGTFNKLHDFNGTDGDEASTALVVGPDGALYGSTSFGGVNGYGTLFRLETNSTFTKLHDFNDYDGYGPSAPLVVGPDGAMYGGRGTLFRVTTSGTFTKLPGYGSSQYAALVVGPDGALYGSSRSAFGGYGTLFRLRTDGTFTKLHDFSGTDGANPSAVLVVGPDGAMYGPTQSGGSDGFGTLFRLETTGAFTVLHDFVHAPEGYGPTAALVVGPDGVLYGSTQYGGTGQYHGEDEARGAGTLFRVRADGTFMKLHDFNGTNGAYPRVPLVVGPDGGLYGSTPTGGASTNGTLFRVETNGAFRKLQDFNDINGAYPYAALVVGPDGGLYGSTGGGGTNGDGTLFRLGTHGTFSKLHDFNGTDGANPSVAVVVGPDGALYGSTGGGGINGKGTLFRLQTSGSFTKLHDFTGADGSGPSTLVVGPDGALYGWTVAGGTYGGSYGYGTLFRLKTNGSFTKLHDFNGDGIYPDSVLVVGPDGALYGTTYEDGYSGNGIVFRLGTNGTFTIVHNFDRVEGWYPSAGLVVGPDGALYGSTEATSPTKIYGTLFRLHTDGSFTSLHSFNGADGTSLTVPLVVGPDGSLYGSTGSGGPRRGGILIKLVLNRPPVARCHDVTVSAGANCAADASVDDGSSDPDAGDTITVRQEPPGPYPLGG
jgi:uncharacterized repeat protein (TIGR03803 family)